MPELQPGVNLLEAMEEPVFLEDEDTFEMKKGIYSNRAKSIRKSDLGKSKLYSEVCKQSRHDKAQAKIKTKFRP